jgi:hypothetical protein
MKKRILIGLVISMAIFGYFYQNRQVKSEPHSPKS